MYLIETSFTSQSVMSDTHPYKSVPGSNRTEGTSKEALAIRIFTIPIKLPITKEISIPQLTVQRQSIGHPIVFTNTRSSPPVFNTIHIVVSQIRNGLYDTKVLSRLTRIVSAYSKISVAFKFKKITTNTHSR